MRWTPTCSPAHENLQKEEASKPELHLTKAPSERAHPRAPASQGEPTAPVRWTKHSQDHEAGGVANRPSLTQAGLQRGQEAEPPGGRSPLAGGSHARRRLSPRPDSRGCAHTGTCARAHPCTRMHTRVRARTHTCTRATPEACSKFHARLTLENERDWSLNNQNEIVLFNNRKQLGNYGVGLRCSEETSCPARKRKLNRAQWEWLLEKIKYNVTFSCLPCKLRLLTQTGFINYYYRPISGWEASCHPPRTQRKPLLI